SGVYEAVADEPNIETSDAALAAAAGLLRRYGEIEQRVTYQTLWPGLRAGQLQHIEVPALGVSGAYLLDSVEAQEFATAEGGELQFTVSALSGEQVGGWAAFWKRLIRSGGALVIRENEVLVLLRMFVDTVTTADTMAATPHNPATDFVVGQAVVGF